MFHDVLSGAVDLSDDELDAAIRANALEGRRLDAEQAALIAVAKNRRLHEVHEHRSINGYLRQTLNCSKAEATRLHGLARAVDQVEGVGHAWWAGRFGASQAQRFAKLHGNRRVRDRLAAAAPLLVEHAEQLPFADFEMCVERFVNRADPDGAHDARDDAIEHRDARVVDVGGMVDIAAHGGDPITSAELIAIFDRFCDAEYRADLEARRTEHGDDAENHSLPRTNRQRRFDAVRTIFHTAEAAVGTGTVGAPLVNIVIDADTWTRLLETSGLTPAGDIGLGADLIPELVDHPVPLSERRCETSTGVQLHPHDVLRAALAGHVRRVVVDSASVVIDMGRRQRLFTGAARQAAMLLVTHCEHPGCDLPADWCDVDHNTEWSAGGETNQANADLQCRRHNLAKTRRRWRTERAVNGRNYTIRPDDTIILPVGARPPTFPPDDDDPDDIAHMESIVRTRAANLRLP